MMKTYLFMEGPLDGYLLNVPDGYDAVDQFPGGSYYRRAMTAKSVVFLWLADDAPKSNPWVKNVKPFHTQTTRQASFPSLH